MQVLRASSIATTKYDLFSTLPGNYTIRRRACGKVLVEPVIIMTENETKTPGYKTPPNPTLGGAGRRRLTDNDFAQSTPRPCDISKTMSLG